MKLKTADDTMVEIDEVTQTKLSAHPEVMELLPEAISKLTLHAESGMVKTDIEMGRVVGIRALVETPEIELNTPTYFAYRKERKFPSHISTTKKGGPCGTVAISVLKSPESNSWKLITAFVGKSVPSEPFYYFDQESRLYKNESQLKTSLEFWIKHALTVEPDVTGEVYESTWEKELEKIKAKFS